VVQVIQPGYAIGDRVLRPALVGVSKGGPKVAPTASASGAATRDA
jgi:molecular chaperone GrpE